MTENEWLTRRFDEHRVRLTGVAYRMLGSHGDAEDAVQETWLRVSRAETDKVENPGGWLTTIVARVCLNMLESRRVRPEDPTGALPPEPATNPRPTTGPEDEALLADSVGVALMVVLDTLTPSERLAFVLHDVFDVSFGEISGILDRSPAATRQLASRARRRVREASVTSDATLSKKRDIVAAFLAAARGGDFSGLLSMLAPDAELVADPAAVLMGATAEASGSNAVAAIFSGRAEAARLALVDGVPSAVWSYRGQPKVVFTFDITDEKITDITMVADPDRLRDLDIVLLSPGDAGEHAVRPQY